MDSFCVLGDTFPLWNGWTISGKSKENVKLVSPDKLHTFCNHDHTFDQLHSYLSNEWELGKSLCPIGDKICETEECWINEGHHPIKLEYSPPNKEMKSRLNMEKLDVISVSFFRPYERNQKDYFYYDYLHTFVKLLFRVFERDKWILRVYIDNSLEAEDFQTNFEKQSETALYKNLLTYLISDKNVQIVRVSIPDLYHEKSSNHHKGLSMTMARYFAMFDKDVETVVCRDVDNNILEIDVTNVTKWKNNNDSGIMLYLSTYYVGDFLEMNSLLDQAIEKKTENREFYMKLMGIQEFLYRYGGIAAGLVTLKNFANESLLWEMMSHLVSGKFHEYDTPNWSYGVDERLLNFLLLPKLIKNIVLNDDPDMDQVEEIELIPSLKIIRLSRTEHIPVPASIVPKLYSYLSENLLRYNIDPTQFEVDYRYVSKFMSNTRNTYDMMVKRNVRGVDATGLISKFKGIKPTISTYNEFFTLKEKFYTVQMLFGSEDDYDYITGETINSSVMENNPVLGLPLYFIMKFLRNNGVINSEFVLWLELVGHVQNVNLLMSNNKKEFSPAEPSTTYMGLVYSPSTIERFLKIFELQKKKANGLLVDKNDAIWLSTYKTFKQIRMDMENGRFKDEENLILVFQRAMKCISN